MQVTFDPTDPAERVHVRALLDAAETRELASEGAAPPDDTSGDAATTAAGTLDADKFLRRTGRESRRFIDLALKHFGQDTEFTFEELSRASGIAVGDLKAWHRNLSRTARSLGGNLRQLLPPRWYGGRQHYKVLPALASAAGR